MVPRQLCLLVNYLVWVGVALQTVSVEEYKGNLPFRCPGHLDLSRGLWVALPPCQRNLSSRIKSAIVCQWQNPHLGLCCRVQLYILPVTQKVMGQEGDDVKDRSFGL